MICILEFENFEKLAVEAGKPGRRGGVDSGWSITPAEPRPGYGPRGPRCNSSREWCYLPSHRVQEVSRDWTSLLWSMRHNICDSWDFWPMSVSLIWGGRRNPDQQPAWYLHCPRKSHTLLPLPKLTWSSPDLGFCEPQIKFPAWHSQHIFDCKGWRGKCNI